MFYIIKPAQHEKYRCFVDDYRAQLSDLYDEIITDEDHAKTTYILDHHPGRGVIGGICLIRKSLASYTAHQKHAFKPFIQTGQVWEANHLLFELPSQEPSLTSPDFNTLCRSFYRNIYESFMNFAVIENIDFLLMKLNADEFDDSLFFGFWPYLSSYIPHDPTQDTYYNVLSLHALDYHTFQSQWGRYDRHEPIVQHQGSAR